MGRRVTAVGLAICALSMAAPTRAAQPAVTVAQVLSDPAAHDGKHVRVHGFVTFEFENNRLWRDEAAFRNYEPTQAIYLRDAFRLPRSTIDETKGRLAFVTGTFEVGGNDERNAAVLTKLTSVEHDPADQKPDRGWSSDPDFGWLVAVLGVLGFVAMSLALAVKARPPTLTAWKPSGSRARTRRAPTR